VINIGSKSGANTTDNSMDELERIRMDKRKKWEQEMQQELNRIDSDKLREALHGIEKVQEKQAHLEVEHLEKVKAEKRKAWEQEMEAELCRLDTTKLKRSISDLNQELQMEIIQEESDRLERVKLEKRKRWEQEMQSELRRISTDKLKDALAELSVDPSSEEEECITVETIQTEKHEDSVQLEDFESSQGTLNKTPMRLNNPEKKRDILRKKASVNNQREFFKEKRITFDESGL